MRNQNNPLVSIVVACLNSEKYIFDCLKSIQQQSLKEIEVICVDAGSTDDTREIIMTFMDNDPRFSLLLSEKKSYGYQMNVGIEKANGIYIGIVESDDLIQRDMFEDLYYCAERQGVDFVKSNYLRMVGNGTEVRLLEQRLSLNMSSYNRCIYPMDEIDCFNYPLNSWTGIYRRDFLINNQIRHNESPGASFQDTGFTLLCFLYAQKVFFIDRAYYMVRRDNSHSSIRDENKVYAICDEHDYVWNAVSKNEPLFEKSKKLLVSRRFASYFGSYLRIPKESLYDFTKRLKCEFRVFEDQELISETVFGSVYYDYLQMFLSNREKNYLLYLDSMQSLFKRIKHSDDIIIYGNGKVSNQMITELMSLGLVTTSFRCAVTKIDRHYELFADIPVYEISELVHMKDSALVIIAVGEAHQEEIKKTLKEYKFRDVVTYPRYISNHKR
ncbi:MAG: glycosyltransferase [Lachnospiraceae bacterium]|nr:glycosyltransferase [Lachnospiraceae bacterium]